MRLLILTQKVDKEDPILGFFHRWIEEFAKHAESIIVICLEKGQYNLPENVKVLSLGKENTMIYHSVFKKIIYVSRFYKYIWNERKNYDSVFVHMNSEYAILGGLLWRILGKKIGLWYVHKAVNARIWLAEKFADIIFTSAPESFSLRSKKVRYVGHGIDTDRFTYSPRSFDEPISIIHVGRITRIKNIYMIIKGLSFLLKKEVQVKSLYLVGEPITADDKKYKSELEDLVRELNVEKHVVWKGSIRNSEIPKLYKEMTLSVNAAPDGGMDKAVLESLAMGCPVFVTNKAFEGVYGDSSSKFFYHDAQNLSEKILSFIKSSDKAQLAEKLSRKIRSEYDTKKLIKSISSLLA